MKHRIFLMLAFFFLSVSAVHATELTTEVIVTDEERATQEASLTEAEPTASEPAATEPAVSEPAAPVQVDQAPKQENPRSCKFKPYAKVLKKYQAAKLLAAATAGAMVYKLSDWYMPNLPTNGWVMWVGGPSAVLGSSVFRAVYSPSGSSADSTFTAFLKSFFFGFDYFRPLYVADALGSLIGETIETAEANYLCED